MSSPSNSRQVVAGENIRAAAVSSDGSRVVYTQERDGKLELRSEGTLIRSIDAQYGAGFAVLLSNDGNRASVHEFLDPVTFTPFGCATMEFNLAPARCVDIQSYRYTIERGEVPDGLRRRVPAGK